ncbi:cobalt-precorrin-5B (C1)-methyltransferase [Sinobacterium caligoides]|uniref:Cobalt-precorrin-5B C(1)-methyltransferase n=1 Tax=Sinobacterium caligoides TaxID=933926 RepID=A0A3N2DYN0_9GAMM|nr:cobalt-precorrin-5B (C(1))-methyltransferase [Sinobacterium caligoides]ROS04894.1 cobalt-precorrin-5B (C1)-methyltransferase [Sinobacterium caligoides]
MWPESTEQPRPLRSGLTTGCCATACCVAAANALLAEQRQSTVTVTLPRGRDVELNITTLQQHLGRVTTTTIKDAGDDPDVTHGAEVFVSLSLRSEKGVAFTAAEGVGTVTREGLLLAVGEPAINPVPRQMMREHLQVIAARHGYSGGFVVAVGVVGGDQLALKTMNPRLGIVGGLSILGTTGVVRPFSCSAYIASIMQGIDVANANGISHVAATTGSSSEAAIRGFYGLGDMALIEMGDFVGAVLKHMKRVPIPRLTLCGGFGKLTKLANGKLDLNSRASSIDFEQLRVIAAAEGASAYLQEKIVSANTTVEVLALCDKEEVDIVRPVCRQAQQVAQKIVPLRVLVEVFAINRRGDIIGCSEGAA